MYHSGVTIFPLGIRMRRVPVMATIQGQNDSIKKATILRSRHSQFKAMMQDTINDEITMMSIVCDTHGKSLRDIIMELKHPKKY